LARYETLAGKPLEGTRVETLRDIGMIEIEKSRLRVLPQGRMVLNSVLSELLVD
jgi:oxygen-independent coproporphyrinogen-3 oxidase